MSAKHHTIILSNGLAVTLVSLWCVSSMHTHWFFPYYTGATAHSNAYFGEGRGKIHFGSVECSGRELNITDCETERSRTSNSHSLDVGVKCQPGIRLLLIIYCLFSLYIYMYMYTSVPVLYS